MFFFVAQFETGSRMVMMDLLTFILGVIIVVPIHIVMIGGAIWLRRIAEQFFCERDAMQFLCERDTMQQRDLITADTVPVIPRRLDSAKKKDLSGVRNDEAPLIRVLRAGVDLAAEVMAE